MRITSDDYIWKRFSIITADFINVDLLLQTLYAVILVSEEIKKDPEYSEIFAYLKELKPFNDAWIP